MNASRNDDSGKMYPSHVTDMENEQLDRPSERPPRLSPSLSHNEHRSRKRYTRALSFPIEFTNPYALILRSHHTTEQGKKRIKIYSRERSGFRLVKTDTKKQYYILGDVHS